MSALREIFERELAEHSIPWCRGTPLEFCDFKNSHARGFAARGEVHYNAEIATRATFLTGLHEIGHVVLGHDKRDGSRRYERERDAQAWAEKRSRELGVPVPQKQHDDYVRYVARMKRWGDNIAAGSS